MTGKSVFSLGLAVMLTTLLAARAGLAEEVLYLDAGDNGPQATATPVPQAPPPTATPLPKPTSTPEEGPMIIALPSAAPTRAPAKAPAASGTPAPSAALSPVPSAGYEGEDSGLSETALHLKRIGYLVHPIVLLTLDGTYARAFQSPADPSVANGFGLDFRVELQFFTWLSLGGYYDFAVFPASGRLVFTGPLGLMGRILPFGLKKKGDLDPFVIGGAGLNSLQTLNSPVYPGDFQGFLGVGAREDFGDGWGLDLAVVANFYSPSGSSLETVSARGGLSYSFQP